MRENPVQSLVSLEASRMGLLPMRNNVGACTDKTGRLIRYGLMNDSKQLNEQFKSSDLIAVTPVRIEPWMVGRTVGVFTALECKRTDWRFSMNDPHTAAQWRFHDLVRRNAGFAGFVQGPEDIRKVLTW